MTRGCGGVALLVLAAAAVCCSATVIQVDGPSNYNALSDAFAAVSANGDVLNFTQPGYYYFFTGALPAFNFKVMGIPPSPDQFYYGAYPVVWTASALQFFTVNSNTVEMHYIDFQQGGLNAFDDADSGPVTVNAGATLKLYDVRFFGCMGKQRGGAIHVAGGTLYAERATFYQNAANTWGVTSCSTLTSVDTAYNMYPRMQGGAIFARDGAQVTINNGIFQRNSAGCVIKSGDFDYSLGEGGDIYAENGAVVKVYNQTFFMESLAGLAGGVVVVNGSTVMINDSSIAPATAYRGALMYVTGSGTAVLSGNVVLGPTSGGSSSLVDVSASTGVHLQIRNVTATGLRAPLLVVGHLTSNGGICQATDAIISVSNVRVVNDGGTNFYTQPREACGLFCMLYAANSNLTLDNVYVSAFSFQASGYVVGALMTIKSGNVLVRDSNFNSGVTSLSLKGSGGTGGVLVNPCDPNFLACDYLTATDATTIGAVIFQRTTIANCEGQSGAGLAVISGTVVLESVTLLNNSAISGGGMLCDSCQVLGSNLVVQGNSASTGTGILCRGTAPSFQDDLVTVAGNVVGSNFASATCQDQCSCCTSQPAGGSFVVTAATCSALEGQTCPVACGAGYSQGAGIVRCTGGKFVSSGTVCTPLACTTAPQSIANGDVSYPRNNLGVSTAVTGDIATYSCQSARGYGLNGTSSTLTCIGPNWVGTLPSCIAGSCTGITAPANGSVSANSAAYGSSVTYDCDLGKMLSGSRSITCSINGTGFLDGIPPTCIDVKCDTTANNVEGGGSALDIGTNVTLTCKQGYAGPATVATTCVLGAAGYPGTFNPAAPECTLCPAGTWAEPGVVDCQKCPFGYTNDTGLWSQEFCECQINYVEATAGKGDCVACPTGAYCAGGKARGVAQPGYYLSTNPTTGVDAFIACTPPEACAGNGSCNAGYTGFLCGACDKQYYKLNGICAPCPDEGPWKLIVGAIVGAMVSLGLVKMAEPSVGSAPSVNFAAPTIGFSFAQVTASFIDIEFSWPQPIRDMCDYFSSLNLNIELANPECSITMTFWDKTAAQIVLPMVIFGFFVVVCIGLVIRAYKRDHGIPGLFRRHASLTISSFVSGFLLFMTLAYLFLAKATVQFFSCVARADGSYTIAKAPNLYCYQSDWNRILPYAVFSLVFYVFGVPFTMCVIFMRIRSQRGIVSASTHPLTAFFVAKYEAKFWYWECIVMLRKFAIVLFAAIFIDTPNVNALLSIAVLFVAAMCTIGLRPFKWDKHDFVEISSLVASLVVLFAGLITTSNTAGDRVKTGMAVISIVVSTIALGAIVICFLSELFTKLYLLRKVRLLGDPTRRMLVGHEQAVTSVVLAAEKTVVSASSDRTLRVWNAMTGEEVRELSGHTSNVTSMSVWRRNFVASCDYAGVIRLWNVRTGHCVSIIGSGLGHLACLNFSVNGRVLAAGNTSGDLVLYELRDEEAESLQQSGDESGDEVIAPPASNFFTQMKSAVGLGGNAEEGLHAHSASASDSGVPEGKIFELKQHIKQAHRNGVRCVLAIDINRIYTGGGDKYTRRWSVERDTSSTYYKAHTDAVTSLLEHDRVLYSGSADCTIRAISLQTNMLVGVFSGHQGVVSALAVAPHVNALISASWDNSVRVWSLNVGDNLLGAQLHVLTGHKLAINALAVGRYDNLLPSDPVALRKMQKEATDLAVREGRAATLAAKAERAEAKAAAKAAKGSSNKGGLFKRSKPVEKKGSSHSDVEEQAETVSGSASGSSSADGGAAKEKVAAGTGKVGDSKAKAAPKKTGRRCCCRKKGAKAGSGDSSADGGKAGKEKKGPSISGLVFAASDDKTLRVFELNMARNIDIRDPLEVLGERISKCLPTFKDPELVAHDSDEATADENAGHGPGFNFTDPAALIYARGGGPGAVAGRPLAPTSGYGAYSDDISSMHSSDESADAAKTKSTKKKATMTKLKAKKASASPASSAAKLSSGSGSSSS